jgi:hypothetical protein
MPPDFDPPLFPGDAAWMVALSFVDRGLADVRNLVAEGTGCDATKEGVTGADGGPEAAGANLAAVLGFGEEVVGGVGSLLTTLILA